jgi:lipoprotein-anchoring transpeptidase ErfK/SrfK
VNTLKSAALVIVLAGVLYGVYVTLHQPPAAPPHGMTQEEVDRDTLEVEMGPEAVGTQVSQAPFDAREESSRQMDSMFPHDGKQPHAPGEGNGLDPSQSFAETLPPGPDVGIGGSPTKPAGHEAPLAEGNSRTGEINLTAVNFKRDWITATYQVDEGKFREALATLTPYYRSPDLDSQQLSQLLEWLDALAAKVIYSQEHLLAPPHVVHSDRERLIDVARKYGVNAQLLASINRDVVNNPDILVVTTRLKVVPGPFRAEVNLAGSEITVFLGNLYAGRFPFALGDEPPAPGEYAVRETKMEQTYFGDRVIPAGNPNNPYGQWWINLGDNACIHGSPAQGQSGPVRGCISLSPQDAQDMAAILTVGAKVLVR